MDKEKLIKHHHLFFFQKRKNPKGPFPTTLRTLDLLHLLHLLQRPALRRTLLAQGGGLGRSHGNVPLVMEKQKKTMEKTQEHHGKQRNII